MDYFSYFKVFPVAVIPQQHGSIFFQTRTQLVYIIAALTASEKESDESSQEPFRCGVGNLFTYYEKLIPYPTVCYTEQISNGSGEKSSASDALSFCPKREKKTKNQAWLFTEEIFGVLQGGTRHRVKSTFQQNQQQAFELCLWGLEGLVWVLTELGAFGMSVTACRDLPGHLPGFGHQEPAGQEEVWGHPYQHWTQPPGKREMQWPQMSTGNLAGDFGPQLKATRECHYRGNLCI